MQKVTAASGNRRPCNALKAAAICADAAADGIQALFCLTKT